MTQPNSYLLILITFLNLSVGMLQADYPCNPGFGLDASGNGVAVWEENTGSGRHILVSLFSILDNSWSPGVTISDETMDSFAPTIAVNNIGDAVVIWLAKEPKSGRNSLQSRMLPIDGKWFPIETITDSNEFVTDDYRARINDQGNLLLVWTSFNFTTQKDQLRSSCGIFNGYWSDPVNLN